MILLGPWYIPEEPLILHLRRLLVTLGTALDKALVQARASRAQTLVVWDDPARSMVYPRRALNPTSPEAFGNSGDRKLGVRVDILLAIVG